MKRICIIGAGAIGSLYAAHLARVPEVEVWCLVRRPEHARTLNEKGLTVSGTHSFVVAVKATSNPDELPECHFAIVATKATQVERSIAPVGHKFDGGAVVSAQNGLGSEEIIAAHTKGYVIRGTTFMSGTRHSDNHVQYELNTATWLGPYEPSGTPFTVVQEIARLLVAGGLKAEALRDCRAAQWSKLIFNASVNSVSALTGLPHSHHFAQEEKDSDLGHLLHLLMDEAKMVARAAGIDLQDDPWKMNQIGARTNHPPSMLHDVRKHQPTEVEFLSGAVAREAEKVGVHAPLHMAMYRLIVAKQSSWQFIAENKAENHAENNEDR